LLATDWEGGIGIWAGALTEGAWGYGWDWGCDSYFLDSTGADLSIDLAGVSAGICSSCLVTFFLGGMNLI